MFMYIVSMTYQIFIPCYFGSIVNKKSEQLPLDLLESNWLGGSASMRRSVTIIGERVKRPIIPFAGGLFAVGLPTFVSVGDYLRLVNFNKLFLILDHEICIFANGFPEECGEKAIDILYVLIIFNRCR